VFLSFGASTKPPLVGNLVWLTLPNALDEEAMQILLVRHASPTSIIHVFIRLLPGFKDPGTGFVRHITKLFKEGLGFLPGLHVGQGLERALVLSS
jgi:hypothetical protein